MNNKKKYALDGLRAYAIILIILSHVNILNQGGVGNCIFFCLSGFLAAQPFNEDIILFNSIRDVVKYWGKKIVRIWPVYAIVVLAVKYLTGRVFFAGKTEVAMILFFIESSGILWYIQQLMIMYILFPLLAIFVSIIAKKIKLLPEDSTCLILFLGLTLFSYYVIYPNVRIRTMSAVPNGFRLFQFLIGVSFAYIYRIANRSSFILKYNKSATIIASSLSLVIVLLGILTSDSFLPVLDLKYIGFYIGWRCPFVVTVVSGFLIVLLTLFPQNVISRLFSTAVLRTIGNVSFDMYLVHYYLIKYVVLETKFKVFAFVFIASFCIGCFLHVLIEEPSIILSKTFDIRCVKKYYKSIIRRESCN